MKFLLLVLAVVLVGCEHKRAKGPFSSTWENLRNGRSTKRSTPTKTNDQTDLPKSLGDLILNSRGGWQGLVNRGRMDNQRTWLSLSYEQLTDVEGLGITDGIPQYHRTSLTRLSLGHNQLTNVKPLENLPKLEKLFLHDNKLTDVTGLENLTQLTWLRLGDNQLTDVQGLEKLTQLKQLFLNNNPALTKAQIDQLQKALPKCIIVSNPTK